MDRGILNYFHMYKNCMYNIYHIYINIIYIYIYYIHINYIYVHVFM